MTAGGAPPAAWSPPAADWGPSPSARRHHDPSGRDASRRRQHTRCAVIAVLVTIALFSASRSAVTSGSGAPLPRRRRSPPADSGRRFVVVYRHRRCECAERPEVGRLGRRAGGRGHRYHTGLPVRRGGGHRDRADRLRPGAHQQPRDRRCDRHQRRRRRRRAGLFGHRRGLRPQPRRRARPARRRRGLVTARSATHPGSRAVRRSSPSATRAERAARRSRPAESCWHTACESSPATVSSAAPSSWTACSGPTPRSDRATPAGRSSTPPAG